MMRLIRKLLGTGKREAQADACLQAHQVEYRKKARVARAKVRAIEQLVTQIQKDVTSWH